MPKCMKCQSIAKYGLTKNDKTHCGLHKSNSMVFLCGILCRDKNCIKQASFGIPGQNVKFCATHKETGMVNLRLTKCDKSGCKLKPCYQGPNKAYCFNHKEDGMFCYNSSLSLNQEVRYALIRAIINLYF